MDAEQDSGAARHVDQGAPLERYAGRILVVCPRCGGRAVVAPLPGLPALRYYTEYAFRPRRLTCGACAATAAWEARADGARLLGATLGGSTDPFFRQPLWLQTRCAGRILWAYDEEHVDALAAYVGARLRERGGHRPTRAMFARLPAWMKRADNRAAVLAGLETLRALAGRSSPAERSDAAHDHDDRPRPYRSSYFRSGPYRVEP